MKKLVLSIILLLTITNVISNIVLDATFYGSLGDFLMKNNQEDQALKAYEKALGIEPENILVLNNLGYYYVDKNPLLAEDYFLKALEIKPDYENARSNLALLYNKLNYYTKAIDQLRILVKEHPDNKFYNYDLAINYADRCHYVSNSNDDLDNAIKYFKIAYQLDKDFMFSMQNIKILEEIRGV